MTTDQVSIFIEERKWDYRGTFTTPLLPCVLDNLLTLLLSAFGFAAALAERLPLIGMIFSISNRIGAAMWAHGTCPCFSSVAQACRTGTIYATDLEKRQHYVAAVKAGLAPGVDTPKLKAE